MVTYDVDGDVAELRIDDGKVNGMSPVFFEEMNAALDQIEQQPPGAVIVIGRDGYFSAGLNLKVLPTLAPEALGRTLRDFGHTLLRVWNCPVPTIAAVTGHAVAGGLFLALACDLRFVARGAFRLQANEHAIGLPIPTWALAITECAVPTASYTEMTLHARPFTPEEGLARGFVTGLADPNDLVPTARAAAEPLLSLDQKAYATTKRRLHERGVAWAEPKIPDEMTAFPVRR